MKESTAVALIGLAVIVLIVFGMYLEGSMVRDRLFDKGEYLFCCGDGKIVGHIEVKVKKIEERWVPAGADSR